eukprot:350816-Chlamydomonas_euryale.AAC.2
MAKASRCGARCGTVTAPRIRTVASAVSAPAAAPTTGSAARLLIVRPTGRMATRAAAGHTTPQPQPQMSPRMLRSHRAPCVSAAAASPPPGVATAAAGAAAPPAARVWALQGTLQRST